MSFLTKKIIDTEPRFFGLDISDLSLKVSEIVRTGDTHKVTSIGAQSLPQGVVIDGIITKEEELITVLSSVRENAKPQKIAATHVVCSLPEIKAFLRIINIPKMSVEEVREAVKWEMEANIPLSIDQVYYDWQLLPRNFSADRNKMSVLVVAVPRNVVEKHTAVLTRANLEVIGFEIESIAQARSLLIGAQKNQTTLIVDIGDRRTSFLIAVDGIPCFTSSIPLSSQSMTDAIAKSLNISIEEAEKAKVMYGVGSALKNDHIFGAMQPVLENFIVEIAKSIDFYLTGLQYSHSVDHIILCGGGARTKGIVPYFSRRLGRDIVLGNPWGNVLLKKTLPPIDRAGSVQFSTAIGLSLKEF